MRVALGAGRARLMRLFLTEGSLLAACAGFLGILLAPVAAQLAIAANQGAYTMRGVDVRLDFRVLGFVLALTAISGLLFGSGRRLAGRARGSHDIAGKTDRPALAVPAHVCGED